MLLEPMVMPALGIRVAVYAAMFDGYRRHFTPA
jgi:hypothetical protein